MKKRINLLYSEKRISSYIKLPFLKKSIFLNAASLFVVLVVVVTVYQLALVKLYARKIVRIQDNLEAIKSEFATGKAKLERIKKEKEDLKKEKDRLDEKVLALASLEEGMPPLSKYLVGIVKLVPEDLWVKNIVFDAEAMKIRGSSFKHESISNFMIELDKSNVFRDTTFNFTERTEEDKQKIIDFEVVTHPVM